MLTLATVLTEAHEELAPLVLPPLAFGGIAAAIFLVLGLVSWSYRDVANRHADKVAADDQGAHH